MKWWSWTTKIFITVGVIGITTGIFLSFLGGAKETGNQLIFELYENIRKAFFFSGFFLLISGIVILSALARSKKNLPD